MSSLGILEGLGLLRATTAIVGATILVYGFRAYRATRRKSILLFAAGMGVASVGYLLEGILVQLGDWTLPRATLMESAFSLTAFSLLAASLWVRDPRPLKPSGGPDPGTRPTIR